MYIHNICIFFLQIFSNYQIKKGLGYLCKHIFGFSSKTYRQVSEKIIDTMKYDEEHLKNLINIMLFLKTWTDISANWKKKYYLKNENKNFYLTSKIFSGPIVNTSCWSDMIMI